MNNPDLHFQYFPDAAYTTLICNPQKIKRQWYAQARDTTARRKGAYLITAPAQAISLRFPETHYFLRFVVSILSRSVRNFNKILYDFNKSGILFLYVLHIFCSFFCCRRFPISQGTAHTVQNPTFSRRIPCVLTSLRETDIIFTSGK